MDNINNNKAVDNDKSPIIDNNNNNNNPLLANKVFGETIGTTVGQAKGTTAAVDNNNTTDNNNKTVPLSNADKSDAAQKDVVMDNINNNKAVDNDKSPIIDNNNNNNNPLLANKVFGETKTVPLSDADKRLVDKDNSPTIIDNNNNNPLLANKIFGELGLGTTDVDIYNISDNDLETQVKISFLDNKSLPYLMVNSFFEFGTENIETYNKDLKVSGKTKRGSYDFKETLYGLNFINPFRSLSNSSAKINMMEFLSLKENQWVETNAVDIYTILLNSKECALLEINSKRRKNFFVCAEWFQLLNLSIQFDTFTFNAFFEVDSGIEYLKYQTLFIPITNNTHWTLVEVLIDKREIIVYDSCYNVTIDSGTRSRATDKSLSIKEKWINERIETLIKWLNYENKKFKPEAEAENINWNCKMGACAQQTNSNDCGIYMLTAAIFLSEQLHTCITSKTYSKIIPHARYRIAIDIYHGFMADYRIEVPVQVLTIHNFQSESKKTSKQEVFPISKLYCGLTYETPIELDDPCSLFARDINNNKNLVNFNAPTNTASKAISKKNKKNKTSNSSNNTQTTIESVLDYFYKNEDNN
jgi:hypothetical protein